VLRTLASQPATHVVGVVTAPPRPVGRRRVVRRTPVHEAADELGLPVLTPERLRRPDAIGSVLELGAALAVLADYGQLVPPPLLELPYGALNLHPSLLPRHRGASPIPATILAGDDRTGVTLMRMDEGLDTGPIVATDIIELSGSETAPELERDLAGRAAELLAATLEPWLRGERQPTPQPTEGATLTRPLRREDGLLDPRRDAAALERQVRAHAPWPGSFIETTAGRIAVLRASVGPAAATDANMPAGTIVADGEGIALTTSDGWLILDEVQPPGGSRMTGAAYRRGHRDILGSTVVATP